MPNVVLFVEDFGHEAFLRALIQRLSDEHGIAVEIQPRSVRGGAGKVASEFRQFLRDLRRGHEGLPDLLIVARDANCRGINERRQELEQIAAGFGGTIVYAIPDPHIERWLLLDSAAFRAVLGRGCAAPDRKCERGRYKRLLLEAMRAAGVTPLLGGIEHTEALVNAMDLHHLERADDSLGRVLRDLHTIFKAWERTWPTPPPD